MKKVGVEPGAGDMAIHMHEIRVSLKKGGELKMLACSIVLILLFIVGIFLYRTNSNELGYCISFLSGILIVGVAIIWPVNYYSNLANVEVYNSTKNTVELSRSKEISEVERAALTTKIIEVNEYLAKAKYWNKTFFEDMVPDRLAELDYLE